jgi:acetyl esterase/lipase
MMTRRLMWLGGLGGLLCLGWFVWGMVPASEAPMTRHEKDVVFATAGDTTLRVDIAMPTQGTGPFPAVVCIHSGGWVGGDRKQMASTIDVLARRGYVAIAPDYRLAPKHRFPACVEDCKAAVRWLRANAGKYHVDPDRVGALGLSAGGHLACLLGVTATSDGLDGTGDHAGKSSQVQAVVAMSAPTDLTSSTLWTPTVLTNNLQPLLGGPPEKNPDLYRKASPARYRPTTPPPFLLIHGSADANVPIQQMRAFSDMLKSCNGSVREVVLADEGHTWAGAALLRSVDQTLTFLDEKLKP